MKRWKHCPGFGATEGTCENPGGSARTPVWCAACDEKRMEYLDKQFDTLRESLARRQERGE